MEINVTIIKVVKVNLEVLFIQTNFFLREGYNDLVKNGCNYFFYQTMYILN